MTEKVQNNVNTAEEVVEKKGCKVFGYNDVLFDPISIDYYHHYIKQLIRSNRLVGVIDDDGEYDIPEKIKRDLVKMEKEIADPNPFYYTLITVYMKKTFNFHLEVEEQENDMASATLYLTENIEGHETVKFVKTFIASVILPYDAEFVPKIRKIFNMVDTVSKVDDTGIPALSVLMQRYFDDDLVFEDIEELGSQIYIIRMLKLLETAGPVGEKIIKEYKKVASKIETKKKGSYSKLRKQLDLLIFENGGFPVLGKLKEELLKPLKEYNDTIKKVEKSQENVGKVVGDGKKKETATEKKTDSKPASSGGGSKPAVKAPPKKSNANKGGKGGGGGAKKKKKPAAKKEKGKDNSSRTVDYKESDFDVDKFLEMILGVDYGSETDDDRDYDFEDEEETPSARLVVPADKDDDEEEDEVPTPETPPAEEEEDDPEEDLIGASLTDVDKVLKPEEENIDEEAIGDASEELGDEADEFILGNKPGELIMAEGDDEKDNAPPIPENPKKRNEEESEG
ncbi:MAG: hypothetical protein NC218_12600 [Acetobacter sp.]|nr:hypothetical protein [Acetobacter sp.]